MIVIDGGGDDGDGDIGDDSGDICGDIHDGDGIMMEIYWRHRGVTVITVIYYNVLYLH